jgi:predicted histone-like DNA-binding protein
MAQLLYKKYKNNNSKSKGYGKWYGRAVITETVGIEAVATRMQDNCTVKRADILAVLSELGPTMGDLLKDSKRVQIPYLGHFKLGISTTGETDDKKFNVRDNVKSVHVIFQPETYQVEQGKRVKKLIEGVVVSELPTGEKPKNNGGNDQPAEGQDTGGDNTNGTGTGDDNTGSGSEGGADVRP